MNQWKLSYWEAGFFFIYFCVLPFFTDMQYSMTFGGFNVGERIIYHLLVSPLTAIPYFLFYKFHLKLLFQKKYLLFFILLVPFFPFLEGYLHLIDWYTWNNVLLPAKTRIAAGQNIDNSPFPRQMVSLTLMHLLSLTGFGYFLKKMEDEFKFRKLKEQHLQLQLDHLKSQLQPHFFFNTLNNIYSLSLDGSENTAPTVAKLAELMRYIIYDGNKKTVSLTSEICFLRNYIQLERIRHSNNTVINFTVKGEPNGKTIEPLLLIPLVENGFKHGINGICHKPWLQVELQVEKNALQFTVKNSKKVQCSDNSGGLGLSNMKQRLQLLYPARHSLYIHDDNNSFTATLILNFEK